MSPDERKTLRVYDADNPYMRESDVSLLRAMAKYIEDLKALAVTNPELAKEQARAMLYQSGVTTKSGKLKKRIVTWD